MQKNDSKLGLTARLDHLFTDREFFMRSHGQVRFLTISAQFQKRTAYSIIAALGLWILFTLVMLGNQLLVSSERLALQEQAEAVNNSKDRVEAYRKSIKGVADDLEQRQDALDQMTEQFIGDQAAGDGKEPMTAAEQKISENTQKISAAVPEAAKLAELEARQIRLAHKLTRAALHRSEQAEAAIRKFGLNPDKLASVSRDNLINVGGPLIPFFNQKDALHPTFERLASALQRMDELERSLIAIPSGFPAASGLMSSGFGYRRDPFTGVGAMHSGIDFKGPIGQPIMAAAKGMVTYAGWKSGYGNTVEITHGNGLLTRYAHLSRIDVRNGQKIDQGLPLGAMGSTGRSTGSHLHFEVRMNDKAMNPRPFLEANTDVLKIKASARQRANTPKGIQSGAGRGQN